jgi:GMP synthase (glutamine-hydrolysing)
MRVLAVTHQRDAGPGVFADAAQARGVALDEWFIAEGKPAPGDPYSYDAVMTFGASAHPDQEEEHAWLRQEKELLAGLIEREVPVLGVCLGSQLVAIAAGGAVRRASEPEIGWYEVGVTEEGEGDALLAPLAPSFEAFEWHSYEVELPPGAVVLARSAVCVQAYRFGELAWGVQFHAEVSRANAAAWIDEYDVDPDAVAMGIDPAKLHAETAPRIDGWNELGRELCGRFLDAATGSDP